MAGGLTTTDLGWLDVGVPDPQPFVRFVQKFPHRLDPDGPEPRVPALQLDARDALVWCKRQLDHTSFIDSQKQKKEKTTSIQLYLRVRQGSPSIYKWDSVRVVNPRGFMKSVIPSLPNSILITRKLRFLLFRRSRVIK